MPRLGKSTPIHVLRVLLTFHLIAVAWVFFRAKTVGDAALILQKIGTHLSELPTLIPYYPFTTEHVLGFGLIGLLLIVEIADERHPVAKRLAAAPVWLRWSIYYLVIFALLILGRWQAKEFIYMQF
jgi:hypothetical protein